MVAEFGGIFLAGDQNLANPGSLEHVLDAIQGSVFGHDPLPTLVEKAAALAWRVIAGHVFHDGNKRTGMEACRLFLDLNGYVMRIDREVIDISLRIACRQVEFEEFVEWVRERTSPREAD
jgi:death on curing protein